MIIIAIYAHLYGKSSDSIIVDVLYSQMRKYELMSDRTRCDQPL